MRHAEGRETGPAAGEGCRTLASSSRGSIRGRSMTRIQVGTATGITIDFGHEDADEADRGAPLRRRAFGEAIEGEGQVGITRLLVVRRPPAGRTKISFPQPPEVGAAREKSSGRTVWARRPSGRSEYWRAANASPRPTNVTRIGSAVTGFAIKTKHASARDRPGYPVPCWTPMSFRGVLWGRHRPPGTHDRGDGRGAAWTGPPIETAASGTCPLGRLFDDPGPSGIDPEAPPCPSPASASGPPDRRGGSFPRLGIVIEFPRGRSGDGPTLGIGSTCRPHGSRRNAITFGIPSVWRRAGATARRPPRPRIVRMKIEAARRRLDDLARQRRRWERAAARPGSPSSPNLPRLVRVSPRPRPQLLAH